MSDLMDEFQRKEAGVDSETHGQPAMVRVDVVSGEQVYDGWRVRYRTPSNQKWREFYLLLADAEQGVPSPEDINNAINVVVRHGR